jgi:hypothetical protein
METPCHVAELHWPMLARDVACDPGKADPEPQKHGALGELFSGYSHQKEMGPAFRISPASRVSVTCNFAMDGHFQNTEIPTTT